MPLLHVKEGGGGCLSVGQEEGEGTSQASSVLITFQESFTARHELSTSHDRKSRVTWPCIQITYIRWCVPFQEGRLANLISSCFLFDFVLRVISHRTSAASIEWQFCMTIVWYGGGIRPQYGKLWLTLMDRLLYTTAPSAHRNLLSYLNQ